MNLHEHVLNLQQHIQDATLELDALKTSLFDFERMASASTGDLAPWMMGLTVFVLACFVGYYVVWRVTPALHSPLMAVTNAISSVIIVGAMMAVGPKDQGVSLLGLFGIFLASINIFGGFVVTQRMLSMFARKKPQQS